MIPFSLPNRRFMQLCWVVPDLQVAMDEWVRTARVGPFFTMSSCVFDDGKYHGKPAPFPNITAAIAQAGDVQIELVCPQDDVGPSIFRDLVPTGKAGFHHVAIYSQDYEADRDAYVAAGSEIGYEGWIMGNRTCWIDTAASVGFMVEVITANPMADGAFAMFREAAETWDGVTDPVRVVY